MLKQARPLTITLPLGVSSHADRTSDIPWRALAIESSSRRGEVALVDGGQVLAVKAFEAGIRHTAGLLPLVRDLCDAHGWRPASIELICVSVGPGGFTGTRIGVTFAKTLAFATGAKVVAVPTAEVLLANLPHEADQALVVVDARRGKVWTQRFVRDLPAGNQWQRMDEGLLSSLSERLAGLSRPVWLIGEGIAFHAQDLPAEDAGVRVVEDHVPRAAEVGRIGIRMAVAGQFTPAGAISPIYVRRPEAEEKRLGLA